MPRRFRNLYPHETHGPADLVRWKFANRTPEPPPFAPPIARDATIAANQDFATWIGHSSFLFRLGTKSILVDPVFSDYCAPFPIRRFKRHAPPGLDLAKIPKPEVVLITHNHYDHLDWPTIRILPNETLFIVPLGLAAWFRARGKSNVRELPWWQSTDFDGLRITSVPAQHFSSRTPWDRDRTLWCGWILQEAGKTLYITGDTGYCPVFREIGAKFGPINLAAIPIGAYEPRWFMKPIHVMPEESVAIHQEVRSKLSVACHWGTFRLTDEPMDEPPKRLAQALQAAQISPASFRVLNIGETITF